MVWYLKEVDHIILLVSKDTKISRVTLSQLSQSENIAGFHICLPNKLKIAVDGVRDFLNRITVILHSKSHQHFNSGEI